MRAPHLHPFDRDFPNLFIKIKLFPFSLAEFDGANSEKQAWEVFRPARLMCKRTPMLMEAFGIEMNASNMNRPEDGVPFEPLTGNPGGGLFPTCIGDIILFNPINHFTVSHFWRTSVGGLSMTALIANDPDRYGYQEGLNRLQRYGITQSLCYRSQALLAG